MAVTIVDAARLMWCPGLAQLIGHPKGTIHEWLSTATYAPNVVDKSIVLNGISHSSFLQALGSDINRTTTVASETLRNIIEIENLPKSLGWPYVKLYYASLFYAHSILRIWGRLPSYFRTTELIALRETLRAYSIVAPFKVSTGQYLVRVGAGATSVTISPENGGGSHEAVWREFCRALSDLRSAVANAPYLSNDKLGIDAGLKCLLDLISRNGQNSSWPSQMRNDIQYRQAEGIWYPYQGKAKTSALQQEVLAILNGQSELTKFMVSTGSELLLFRSTCAAIICFARAVIADMGAVGGAKSFLRHGQRKFEDAVPVAV